MEVGNGHIEAILTELAALREELRTARADMLDVTLGEDALLTEEEAARMLDVSPRTLRRMRENGDIRAGFIGKFPRYSLGQIRRFARATVEGKR